jgi:hypothetical protein
MKERDGEMNGSNPKTKPVAYRLEHESFTPLSYFVFD